jgi:hypothetical protein
VYPRTIEFLDSLGEANHGRAVDRLVDMHKTIMRAVRPELREKLEPLPPLVKKSKETAPWK